MPNPPRTNSVHTLTIKKLRIVYDRGLCNHGEDPTNARRVRCDESGAEVRLVRFLATSGLAAAVLDLGCGNGSLLRAPRGRGRLLGVVYGRASVVLLCPVAPSAELIQWDSLPATRPPCLPPPSALAGTSSLTRAPFEAASLGSEDELQAWLQPLAQDRGEKRGPGVGFGPSSILDGRIDTQIKFQRSSRRQAVDLTKQGFK
jgi:hypothetical protein